MLPFAQPSSLFRSGRRSALTKPTKEPLSWSIRDRPATCRRTPTRNFPRERVPTDSVCKIHPPEVTPYSVGWGIVMAILFSAAAAYSGLKIGQVFEAAIPIAILAVGISTVRRRPRPSVRTSSSSRSARARESSSPERSSPFPRSISSISQRHSSRCSSPPRSADFWESSS